MGFPLLSRARVPRHREHRRVNISPLPNACVMEAGVLASTHGTCLAHRRRSINAQQSQRVPGVVFPARAKQGWFTIAQRNFLNNSHKRLQKEGIHRGPLQKRPLALILTPKTNAMAGGGCCPICLTCVPKCSTSASFLTTCHPHVPSPQPDLHGKSMYFRQETTKGEVSPEVEIMRAA